MGLSLRDTLIDEPAKRPHSRALLELARKANQRLLYGASVAGGVPVLCGLEQGLAGDAFPADWRSQWHVQLHPEPDAERSCQFYHSARTSTGIGIRRSRSFA